MGETCEIILDAHGLIGNRNALKQPRKPFTRRLDMMESAAVADHHSPCFYQLQNIDDATSDCHRFAVFIQTVRTFHPSFWHQQNAGFRIERFQEVIPRVISLARDRDHLRDEHANEATDDRAIHRDVRNWHCAVICEQPHIVDGRTRGEKRFEETRVIEDHADAHVPEIVGGGVADVRHIESVEDSTQGVDRHQK